MRTQAQMRWLHFTHVSSNSYCPVSYRKREVQICLKNPARHGLSNFWRAFSRASWGYKLLFSSGLLPPCLPLSFLILSLICSPLPSLLSSLSSVIALLLCHLFCTILVSRSSCSRWMYRLTRQSDRKMQPDRPPAGLLVHYQAEVPDTAALNN